MKAYMYDVDNGIYEGETFEEESSIKYVDGLTKATPPAYAKGQVPVFDQDSQKWSIEQISEMKQHLSCTR